MRATVEPGPRIGRRGVGSAVLFGGLLGFHATATPEALASKLSGNIIEQAIRHEEGRTHLDGEDRRTHADPRLSARPRMP